MRHVRLLPRRRGALGAGLVLLLLQLPGLACAGSTMRVYETPHFSVYADLTASQHEDLARDIQFAANAARYFTGIEWSAPTRPVEFFLTGDLGELWRHTANRRDRFAWSDTPSGARYLLDGRSTLDGQRHDLELALVHHALRRAPGVPPLWFEVGFSAFLETVDLQGGSVVVGKLEIERLKALREIAPIDIQIALDPARMAALSPSRRRGYDAVAWLMVHYLMLDREDRSGRPPGDRFRLYTAAIEQGLEPGDALEQAWGITARQLRHRIEALAAGQIRTTRFRRVELSRRAIPVEPTNPSPAEVERALGRLHASLGRPDRAHERLERAIRLDPEDARARAALARLHASAARIPEALDLATRAIEMDPSDPDVLIAHAVACLTAARNGGAEYERAALLDAARNDLELARVLDPDNPEILFALGRVDSIDPRSSNEAAIHSLEAARAALPNDRAIRLALLEVYASAGHARDARRLAASLSTDARDRADLARVEQLLGGLGELAQAPWRRD